MITRYYNENKAAIMADRAALGDKVARERWSIPSSTWGNLIRRFEGKPRGGKPGKRPPAAARQKAAVATPEPVTAGPDTTSHEEAAAAPEPSTAPQGADLPPFPEFDAAWSTVVQVTWLMAYLVLVKR